MLVFEKILSLHVCLSNVFNNFSDFMVGSRISHVSWVLSANILSLFDPCIGCSIIVYVFLPFNIFCMFIITRLYCAASSLVFNMAAFNYSINLRINDADVTRRFQKALLVLELKVFLLLDWFPNIRIKPSLTCYLTFVSSVVYYQFLRRLCFCISLILFRNSLGLNVIPDHQRRPGEDLRWFICCQC